MHSAKTSLVVLLLIAAPVLATSPSTTEKSDSDPLLGKMEQVNAQYRQLLDQMEQIDEKRRRLELLMYKIDDLDQYRGRMDISDQPDVVGTERKEALEAQQNKLPELPRVAPDIGGVLTPKGRLILEPSMQYLYSSVNRVAIEGFTILPALLVGVIDILEADRDTYIAGLTARYGVTDRLELELKGSFIYRDDATRSREFLTNTVEESVFKAQGEGLGDLELGLRYQFKRRKPTAPFLVGNLRIKSENGTDPFDLATQSALLGGPEFGNELPTGSGFWSVNPSLTFIYPSDPVVFFGNVGYLWTIENDKGLSVDADGNVSGFGTVDPGDAFRLSFGLGLGLNDRSSFSISYQVDQYTKTWIETARDGEIAGSDVTVGKLLIGYSLRLPGGAPLNLAVGIGTTDDAPDTDLTFRMPFTVRN